MLKLLHYHKDKTAISTHRKTELSLGSFDLERDCPIESLNLLAERLYPICRSITGDGFQASMDILEEIMPMTRDHFFTGQSVLDWTIPEEWNITDAYIITPNGEKIADFRTHNLHVMGYSEPIDAIMPLDELRPHLYSLPDTPEAIPYVTSYYKRNWGFCITHRQFESLAEGNYRVVINSELKPGKMTIGQTILPGDSADEILLSSYLCHPSMGNHELGGPITLVYLYKLLKESGPHRHTFRFLLCPENIGATAFLSKYGDHLERHLVGGYVINCVAHGQIVTYKKSRRSNTAADLAAINYLKYSGREFREIDFFPDGSDERQFCSPGFNFPIGLVMREMYGTFAEYHTSLDNLDFFSAKTLQESISIYIDILQTLDANFTPLGSVLKGTPQLSKSAIPLYRETMNFRIVDKNERTRVLLEILNCADGTGSLLEIAEAKGFSLFEHLDLVEDLIMAGYIEVTSTRKQ